MSLITRLGEWLIRKVVGEVAGRVEKELEPEEMPMPLTQRSVGHIQEQIAQATSPRAIVPAPIRCIPPPRPPRKTR